MKITGVELTPVASRRETGDVSRHVVIRLQTDGGLVGLGEMSDVGDWGVMYDINDIKGAYESLVVGKNPLDWRSITIAAGSRLRMGGAVRAGLEIGLFDLVGKIQNVSVAGVFGGSIRDKMRVCYPIFRNYSSAFAQFCAT